MSNRTYWPFMELASSKHALHAATYQASRARVRDATTAPADIGINVETFKADIPLLREDILHAIAEATRPT